MIARHDRPWRMILQLVAARESARTGSPSTKSCQSVRNRRSMVQRVADWRCAHTWRTTSSLRHGLDTNPNPKVRKSGAVGKAVLAQDPGGFDGVKSSFFLNKTNENPHAPHVPQATSRRHRPPLPRRPTAAPLPLPPPTACRWSLSCRVVSCRAASRVAPCRAAVPRRADTPSRRAAPHRRRHGATPPRR